MVEAGKELLELSRAWPEKIDGLAFGKKALEFIKHLSVMGGFCDAPTKSAISTVVSEFTALLIDPNMLENFTDTRVKLLIPMTIGIQVDFTNRPFQITGWDKEVFPQLKLPNGWRKYRDLIVGTISAILGGVGSWLILHFIFHG